MAYLLSSVTLKLKADHQSIQCCKTKYKYAKWIIKININNTDKLKEYKAIILPGPPEHQLNFHCNNHVAVDAL